MSIRTITAFVVLFLLAALGLWFTWELGGMAGKGLEEADAARDTGVLIIEYLETHDGQWPQSWDDLLTAVATLHERGIELKGIGRYGDGPEALRERVSVDWTADPLALAGTPPSEDPDKPPFTVVRRKDGDVFSALWDDSEPNEMIRRYLAEAHAPAEGDDIEPDEFQPPREEATEDTETPAP